MHSPKLSACLFLIAILAISTISFVANKPEMPAIVKPVMFVPDNRSKGLDELKKLKGSDLEVVETTGPRK